jgi:3-hydroxy-5-methyl-1-naphthoate 3-O-methyltransferase
MKKIESPAELLEIINGFRLSRILLTAHELKVFDHLSGKSFTSTDLASLINSDARATDRLMNVLVSLGLLIKNHGLFTNSSFAEKFLVSSSSAFLGGLGHTADLWRKWSTLTHVIRKGSALDLEDNFNQRGSDWIESFIAAMHARGVAQGRELASMLDLSNTKRSLDVGGGSGAFTFGFIEKNPDIQGVVFDLPNVVPVTQKYIDKANLVSSVVTASGDYLIDDLGSGFDLVLMSAIIHINNPEENRQLIKKGADALLPGGQLVIMDHLMSEDRTEPLQGAVFAINMLVGTKHGDTYTRDEIGGWMTAAGLHGIKILEVPSGTQYIIGLKS